MEGKINKSPIEDLFLQVTKALLCIFRVIQTSLNQ